MATDWAAIKKKLDAGSAAGSAAPTPMDTRVVPPGSVPTTTQGFDWSKVKADLDAKNKPPEPSPYDTVGGTVSELAKVLGSGIEQAGTGIAGMPAMVADTTNAGIGMLPEWAQKPASTVVNAMNPVIGLSRTAREAGVAPSAGEMDQYLQDKGLQHKPINAAEDWAQYLIANAAGSAIPVGEAATLANTGKNMLLSLLPAVAAKGVSEAAPDSKWAGPAAGVIAAIAQHGVGSALPSSSVKAATTQAAKDAPAGAAKTLEDYRAAGRPAMAADVLGPQTRAMVGDAVANDPLAGQALVDALRERNVAAPARVQATHEAAVGGGAPVPTRAQYVKEVEAAKKAQADVDFPTVRAGSKPVDIQSTVLQLSKLGRGQKGIKPDALQVIQKDVASKLSSVTKATDTSPAVRTAVTDPAKIYSVMGEVEAAIKRNPHLAGPLGSLKQELDSALEAAYPHYADIKANFEKASQKVEAADLGAEAAKRGNLADTMDKFNNLGKKASDPSFVPDPAHVAELQQAFKTGHADILNTNAQNTVIGSKVKMPNTTAAREEVKGIYGPDPANTYAFEDTAHGTYRDVVRPPAVGGSIVDELLNSPLAKGAKALNPLTWAAGKAASMLGPNQTKINQMLLKIAAEQAPDKLAAYLKHGKGSSRTISESAIRGGLIPMITGR